MRLQGATYQRKGHKMSSLTASLIASLIAIVVLVSFVVWAHKTYKAHTTPLWVELTQVALSATPFLAFVLVAS
jgi:membrane protein YdbS with pleckstrin-like domain